MAYKKKISDFILTTVFYLLYSVLIACQSGYSIPADTLRVKLGAEPATLNPVTASDAYAGEVNGYLFDNLIDRNKDTLDFMPKIATRWQVSADKKTYTFYLRNDVHWHDGKLLTADDVVYSFELIQNPKVDAPSLRVYYKDIERVQKIDDFTVAFHYSQIYFMGLSVCGSMPIVPKHIVSQYSDFEASPFSRIPVGNGPYKFKEWITNNKIVLIRNENYWGSKPQIREIQFRIIADAGVGFQVLKKGELDVYDLTAIQWTRQAGTKRFNSLFNKFIYPSPGFSYIGWNNANPIFTDSKVRCAMTHMVDREKISKKLSFGLYRIVTSPFFPNSKQYNTNIKAHAYNPERAKELLTEAGWHDANNDGWLEKDGKSFAFTFLYPSASTTTERVATILKEDLKRLGVKMDIVRLEWAAFLEKLQKREFDATMLGWGSPPEMDPYQIFDVSQADEAASSNHISYRSQPASDLIREARIEFDEQKRNNLYFEFQEILHADQPYTFMFNSPSMVVVSKRFGNVKLHKAGLDVLEWTVGGR